MICWCAALPRPAAPPAAPPTARVRHTARPSLARPTSRPAHIPTPLAPCSFGMIVARNGLPPRLALGLLPTIPEGAAQNALSLMGTTAVPLNVRYCYLVITPLNVLRALALALTPTPTLALI